MGTGHHVKLYLNNSLECLVALLVEASLLQVPANAHVLTQEHLPVLLQPVQHLGRINGYGDYCPAAYNKGVVLQHIPAALATDTIMLRKNKEIFCKKETNSKAPNKTQWSGLDSQL